MFVVGGSVTSRLWKSGGSVVPGIRNLVRRWEPVMYNGGGGCGGSVVVVGGVVWLWAWAVCVEEEVEVLVGCGCW